MSTKTEDVTCIKCNTEADYNSPHYLCKEHWQEWWDCGLSGACAASEDDKCAAHPW